MIRKSRRNFIRSSFRFIGTAPAAQHFFGLQTLSFYALCERKSSPAATGSRGRFLVLSDMNLKRSELKYALSLFQFSLPLQERKGCLDLLNQRNRKC